MNKDIVKIELFSLSIAMSTLLTIKVIPHSQENAIVSFEGEVLKVKLKAAPEKGKANNELVRFLAKELDLRADEIEFVSGHTQRTKRLRLPLTLEEILFRIKKS